MRGRVDIDCGGDPFTASSSCRAPTCTPELRKSRKLRRQKYSRDGKLLLQIGVKGKVDSADGSVAVDPENGDVFVADGYVSGKELSQFGRRAATSWAAAESPRCAGELESRTSMDTLA